jgi:hypothetical protein
LLTLIGVGFPLERATQIAISTVRAALEKTSEVKQVRFICFSDSAYEIYQLLLEDGLAPSLKPYPPPNRPAQLVKLGHDRCLSEAAGMAPFNDLGINHLKDLHWFCLAL